MISSRRRAGRSLLGPFFALFSLAFGASGCGEGEDEDGPSPFFDPAPLPPLASARLTTGETLAPSRPPVAYDPDVELRDPAVMDRLLSEGFGDVAPAPGVPVVPHTLGGEPAPPPGPNRRLLFRFVHLADAQLADDESPTRFVSFDSPGELSAAFRPHEASVCRILNAAVRTVNAAHREAPIDFVLLGGDNADSAQENEIDWFQAILGGSPKVECDSGEDDDPVPGPDNDPKDAFFAEGLDVPWRWVTGNHDVLVQGNFPVAGREETATGSVAGTGTRDWSRPGGPWTLGEVPADPRRALVTRARLLEKVLGDGDGHGVGAADLKLGKAQYAFDAPGGLVRFLVLDTAAETGGARGIVRQGDVEAFLRPALDAARAEGKLVVLVSHHASRKLSTDGGAFGKPQPDAVPPEAFQALVGEYDNVLMHLGAHAHEHHLERIEPPGGHPYFEIETSALVDYPHQVRLFEVYEDSGFVSVRAVALDFQTAGDPLAEDGRRRGIVDLVTGNLSGEPEPESRNVELFVRRPDAP